MRHVIVSVFVVAVMAGCAGRPSAPVSERAAAVRPAAAPTVRAAPDARPENYTVKRGDTLHSIALDHGLDYRELADWNGVTNPNVIHVGDVLRLRGPEAAPAGVVQVKPVTTVGPVMSRSLDSRPIDAKPMGSGAEAPAAALKPDQSTIARIEPRGAEPKAEAQAPKAESPPVIPKREGDDDEDGVDWGWPAGGKMVAKFVDPDNKGVDIAAKLGDPVLASAPGKVVYSGSGLRGYGKLIIIKHNKTYLSAYAHNDKILVKEGQNVTKGQKIGEAGATDTDAPKLHFEIRRLGKPVDPMKYLPERPS
jgi:lipoprotein NlpD